LQAKPLIEQEFKVTHLKKSVPDMFVYFPKENTLLLNSKMLRIYEDFDFKKNIGHGILAYDHAETTVDLHLNYSIPARLDLENGESKFLYVFFDPKTPDANVLDSTLDASYGKDRVFDKLIFQFILRKENLIE